MYKSSEGEMTPVTLCYASDDPLGHSDFREAIESMSGNFRFFSLTADFLTSKQSLPSAAIIFVDLSHSDFTGYQIIKFLRESKLFFKTPIVVLSPGNDFRTRQTCWESGADLYIVKPLLPLDLVPILEYVATTDWSNRGRDKSKFLYVVKKSATA